MVVVGDETRSVQSYQFGIEMYIVAPIAVIFYVVQSYQFGIEMAFFYFSEQLSIVVQSYQFGIEMTKLRYGSQQTVRRSIVPVWN